MLMTALVDPAAFDKKLFGGAYYGSCVKHFLEDMVIENGLLLADCKSRLIKDLERQINALPSKYGIPIQEYMVKALSNRRRFVELEAPSDSDLSSLIYRCPPDAIFTSPERVTCFKGSVPTETSVLSFLDYQDSRFQNRRRRFQRGHLDLEQLGYTGSKEIFARTVRFAKKLGIYDKQIGRTNSRGIKRFFEGIDYILDIWRKNGYFMTKNSFREVDIYTCIKHGCSKEYRIQAIDRLRDELICPLQEKYSEGEKRCKIKLHLKMDNKNKMHARYLDAQAAILHIDRGFDFFYRRRRFKANPVSFRSPVDLHRQESVVKTLRKWRDELPTAGSL